MKPLTANEYRQFLYWFLEDHSHERIGDVLGLSAGFVGMVLAGTRAPSRAILTATGFERVLMYRLVDHDKLVRAVAELGK